MRLAVCFLAAFALEECLARGTFEPPSEFPGVGSRDVFATERLKSFRGGFDRGDVAPGRARRPQPDYDNYQRGGVNFWDHEIIYLEGNMVLDWQPRSGKYRIYEIVRHPEDMCPVIPERPVLSGVWEDRKMHKFLYIGCSGAPPGAKLFDYNPTEGTYEIWRFDHKAEPGTDPMLEMLAKGFRREVMNFNAMYLNEDEIFFYDGNTLGFSIYYLNNQLPSIIDPIQPPEPITYGKLQSLHQQQIYVGQNTIMDYDPTFGRYWMYRYNRAAVDNSSPIIGPLSSGMMEKGMVVTYLAEDQVLMLDPETGLFGVFDFIRPPPYDAYALESKTEEERRNAEVEIFELRGPTFQLKKEPGNFGFGSIVSPDQCKIEPTCKQCLKKPGCGWCATTSQCYRGGLSQPCATNCTTWQPVFCEAEPCSSYKTCSDCLSDPFCGWCSESWSCTEGTDASPLFGECSKWSKSDCPVTGPGGLEGSAPCVDGGLISL